MLGRAPVWALVHRFFRNKLLHLPSLFIRKKLRMYDQRPWLKNYPEGIPANIDTDAYSSVVDLLDETFEKFKN